MVVVAGPVEVLVAELVGEPVVAVEEEVPEVELVGELAVTLGEALEVAAVEVVLVLAVLVPVVLVPVVLDPAVLVALVLVVEIRLKQTSKNLVTLTLPFTRIQCTKFLFFQNFSLQQIN